MRTLRIDYIPDYGYLPSVTDDGREVYRGEFRDTPEEALERAKRYFAPVITSTMNEKPTAGLINPADFATTPVMHLRLTLAELTRTIIDLEDARDQLSERIAAIQERMESLRVEIKRCA